MRCKGGMLRARTPCIFQKMLNFVSFHYIIYSSSRKVKPYGTNNKKFTKFCFHFGGICGMLIM